jgi:NTE family protein
MSWALVLSGGGTSGLAWLTGLLAGLQGAGADVTRPDLVVGTSAGAIAGARMASGLSLDVAYAREREPAVASPRDTSGLLRAVDELRRELAGAESWPELPLQITALEVGTGKLVVWTRGAGVALADAVASSCAAPFAAPLPTIKGRLLTDAGPLSATNAHLAFGHRLVVVMSSSGPKGPVEDEIAQLRAGGSHVHLLLPDEASSKVLVRDLLNPGRRAAAAEAGHAQGVALAPSVSEWLASRHVLVPQVEVEDLAARFAVPSLRKAEWTHVAHLAVGAWHVDRYGATEALVRLRDGIQRLNVSIGGANTPSSGYHETITAAYATLIATFLDACPPGLPLAEKVDQLLASPVAARDMLLTFYSRERLFSAVARARWVDPDLAPLRLDILLGRPSLTR